MSTGVVEHIPDGQQPLLGMEAVDLLPTPSRQTPFVWNCFQVCCPPAASKKNVQAMVHPAVNGAPVPQIPSEDEEQSMLVTFQDAYEESLPPPPADQHDGDDTNAHGSLVESSSARGTASLALIQRNHRTAGDVWDEFVHFFVFILMFGWLRRHAQEHQLQPPPVQRPSESLVASCTKPGSNGGAT